MLRTASRVVGGFHIIETKVFFKGQQARQRGSSHWVRRTTDGPKAV